MRPRAAAALVLAAGVLPLARPAAVRAADGPAAGPLRVEVSGLTPYAVDGTHDLVVRGRLTSDVPLDHLHLSVLATGIPARAGLAAERANPTSPGAPVTVTRSDIGNHSRITRGATGYALVLHGRDVLAHTGETPFAGALTVVATGTTADGTFTQGRTELLLPVVPSTPNSPPEISVVIPVTFPPGAGPGDAPFVQFTAPLGGLDTLLTSVTKGVASSSGPAFVTLAVDPALVERLCAAASCPDEAQQAGLPPAVAQQAKARLAQLKQLAATPGVHLSALSYGDADLDALVRAGQHETARSLVGEAGQRLHALLGAPAGIDPVLPPGGTLTQRAVDELLVRGAGTVVVDQATLPPDPAVSRRTATPTAAGVVTGTRGASSLAALVTDPALQTLLTQADSGDIGQATTAVESILAETGAVTAEAPNGESRSLVLVAPRQWGATGAYIQTLVKALGLAPWLQAADPSQAAAVPALARAAHLAVDPGDELPASTLADVAALRAGVDEARTLLTVPTAKTATATATAVTGPLESELDRACSAFWRGTAAPGGLALRQDVRARLGVLLSGVSAQVAGQVLVTGSSGRLPVQLENRLPYPVHVRVRLDSPGTTRIVPVSAEFTIPAAPAGSTTKSQQSLAITSRSAGRFPVQLQLQTTRGEVLGSVHPVEIRSQNYGPVAVGITAGALFVLVVALLVRALRALRRRSRRRAATTPA